MIESEIYNNEKNSEKINLIYLNNILANSKDAKKYINKLKTFFNDYFLLSSHTYNRFNELYHKFCSQKNDTFINTPIYKIQNKIKNIIEFQKDFLHSMISNIDAVTLIQDKLSELEKIIEKLPSKINNFSFNGINYEGADKISDSIHNYLNILENKIIDEYISKKYNKHLSGVNYKDSIDDLVSNVQYLENTLVNIIHLKKSQYFDELKRYYNITNNVFCEISNGLESFIIYIKEENKKYIDGIISNEKEINLKELKNEKNNENNEKYIISKSDFVVKEQDINRFKYKIKILKSSKIYLENHPIEEKKQDEVKIKLEIKEKDSLDSMYKSNKELSFLFLDDKDIYEIVSKFYSYNFFILDISQNDLSIAKGKLDAMDISDKLLSACDEKEEENLIEEKYDEIIKLINGKILNDINNIRAFFLSLNNYRGKGKNEFPSKLYDLVVYIYNKTLDYLLKNPDKNLADLSLILSQTYYKQINGEKIYLAEGIKSHELYQNINFWENIIIVKIDQEFKAKKKILPSSKQITLNLEKNKDEIIMTQIFPFISIMKEFNFSNDKIQELIGRIITKYKCSESTKEDILSYFSSI